MQAAAAIWVVVFARASSLAPYPSRVQRACARVAKEGVERDVDGPMCCRARGVEASVRGRGGLSSAQNV